MLVSMLDETQVGAIWYYNVLTFSCDSGDGVACQLSCYNRASHGQFTIYYRKSPVNMESVY